MDQGFSEVFGGKPLLKIDEIIPDGDDFVVSKLRWTGHGSSSGAPLDLAWINVMWFRDGKMSRGVGYTNSVFVMCQDIPDTGLGTSWAPDLDPSG